MKRKSSNLVLPLLGASLLCIFITTIVSSHIAQEVVHKICEIIRDMFKYCFVSGSTDQPAA